MSSYLVTGGLGFLGSHLVGRLLQNGADVIVLDPGDMPDFRFPTDRLRHVKASTSDTACLRACVKQAEVIFHFAGSLLPNQSNERPADDISTTLLTNIQLLTAAAEHGAKKVVFASSGGTVYGIPSEVPISESHTTNPISSYGIVKLTTEKYLALFERLHNLKYVAIRYSNPYGEGQHPFRGFGAIASFLGAVGSNRPITVWGNGTAIRDFLYIDDAIEATLLAARYTGEERVFNVGTSCGTSVQQLIAIVEEVTGLKARINYMPPRAADVPAIVLDISRAQKELDWKPITPLAAGISRTWAWYRSQFPANSKGES